jgi:hypothetical protein
VYTPEQVQSFVALYLTNAPREQLDPLLDACAAEYIETLDEDERVAFKGSAKAFVRTYDFLSAIIAFSNAEWEKLSICLSPGPDIGRVMPGGRGAGVGRRSIAERRVAPFRSAEWCKSDRFGTRGPLPTVSRSTTWMAGDPAASGQGGALPAVQLGTRRRAERSRCHGQQGAHCHRRGRLRVPAEFADLIDLSVLVQTPEPERHRRMLARAHGNDRWWSRWAAAENLYFTSIRPPESFDVVVAGY